MTPTTRYLCPLDCGWHHDSRDLPDLAGLSGNTIEEIIRAGVERRVQADEAAVRGHLESHPLIDWVTEVARLQRELNAAVAAGGVVSDAPCWLCAGKGALAVHNNATEQFGRPLWTAHKPTSRSHPVYPCPACGIAPLHTYATQVSAIAPGGNAEDCPRCSGTNPPYPFICPGHPAEGALAPDCRWPACLSEADQQLLAEQVGASMLGEETALMPDPRPGCGCVDRGVGRAWVAGGPDCGFPSVPPRKHSAELQQQVAERFGFPLRTPATGGEQQ